MRTFWTDETVARKADKEGFANPHEWILDMQRQFEKTTRVKWSASHQGGGYRFHPVDDGVVAANMVATFDLVVLKDAVEDIGGETGYVSYMDASVASGISLVRLIPMVKWMERRGEARRTVNRMGKGFAFKLVKQGGAGERDVFYG